MSIIDKLDKKISDKKNQKKTKDKIESELLNKINKIDVLKIDAEGSELDILLGGKNILKYTYMIQIEILGTKNNFTEVYSEICSFLQKNYNSKLLIIQ